jgi:uncharacterized membrane protein
MAGMVKTKTIAFVALMAALASVMSYPPFAIPIQFGTFNSSIHFFQLAIFVCAILSGAWAGAFSGAVGSLYMSITRVPFVIGAFTGLFAKKFRPVIACILAFFVQVPYTLVTDYVYFTIFTGASPTAAWTIILPIMVTLSFEAVVCAVLAEVIVHYVKKAGISF